MIVDLDIETTGLSEDHHEIIEVAWWPEDGYARSIILPHTLWNSNPEALRVNDYWSRRMDIRSRWCSLPDIERLYRDLRGATVAGSNPDFDKRFLKRLFKDEPWHHRSYDVTQRYAARTGLRESLGLAETVADAEDNYGVFFERKPNHTAMGDMCAARTLRLWITNDITDRRKR